MQVMPENYKRMGYSDADMGDWSKNMNAGLAVLDDEYRRFKNPMLALAAYNAGSPKVTKYLKGGGALPQETMEYVPKIIARSAKWGGSASPDAVQEAANSLGWKGGADSLIKAGGMSMKAPRPDVTIAPQRDFIQPLSLSVPKQTTAPQVEQSIFAPMAQTVPKENNPLAAFANMETEPFSLLAMNKIMDKEEAARAAKAPKGLYTAFGVEEPVDLGSEIDGYINKIWDDA